ncbi:efflux RND transporter periplasmic adaptor subunit, partial [Yoonia sp.]|nr:efflux RND transporter periplasmic adaptor subunit [Yoonia sp.]
TIERSIVPGFDGFIASAPVRAGDLVSEGDLLVQLDDRDLTLERLRLVTQRQRQQIEFDRAVATRDRAEINIRQTLIDQADAEIALLDEQILRTRLAAPFDGLIVSGDLSQSIGSSVTRGEPLLTIAPANAYRVILQVDERQIADLTKGQDGALRVTALPNETFAVAVEKITPVATYAEGATTFEVEALFTGNVDALRPGMQGVARVAVEERRLIAIWTKPLMDWARITLWRWLPA